MPIHLPVGPPVTVDQILQSAQDLLNAAPPQSRMRAASSTLSSVNVSPPYKSFVADARDVLADRILIDARETTWRYFLTHSDGEPFAVADVIDSEVSGVNEGPLVQASAAAMIAAEDFASGRESNYELRLLHLPSVYAMAVWLKAPGEDVIFPVAPAPTPLIANMPYGEEAYAKALRPVAEGRMRFGGQPKQ